MFQQVRRVSAKHGISGAKLYVSLEEDVEAGEEQLEFHANI